MTMAAAIEDRTADANAGRKRAASPASISFTTSPAAEADLAQPGRPAGILHAVSALRFPQALAAPGRRARGSCSLHRDRLRREPPAAAAVAARAQARLWRALRQLHGRQAFDLQHGAVGPGFRRKRDARRSRRPDIGAIATTPRPTCWRCTSSRCAGATCQIRSRCCRINPRPTTARC